MATRTMIPTRLMIPHISSYKYEPPSPPSSPSSSPSLSPSNSSDSEMEVAMILFQEARRASISPSRHPSAYQTPVRINSHKQHHHHLPHYHNHYHRMPLTPPEDGFEADSEDLDGYDEVDEDLFHSVQRVLNASTTGALLEYQGLTDASNCHMSTSLLQDVVVDDSDDWSGWSSDQFPSEDDDGWEAFGESLRDALGTSSQSKVAPSILGTSGRKRKHAHEDSESDSDESTSTANYSSPSGKKKPKASTARSTAVVSITDENGLRMCMYCSCTETPMWRHGPPGHDDLCNKCGIKWMRGRILQDTKAPNANVVKRRESTRR